MKVGTKVKLNRDMLGEKAGTIGYVYEEYPDFQNPKLNGVGIIFEKGGRDGFSIEEQKKFLEDLGIDKRYVDYHFRGAMYVDHDWRRGYWSFNE